jgi:drug/metabolite transporter (DMT)-like permease
MAIRWTDRGYSQLINSFKTIIKDRKKLAAYSIGFSLAIAAAALNAVADVLPKPILDDGISFSGLNPISMVAVMYLINGLVFTGISAKKNPYKDVGKKNFWFLVIIGGVEITATTTFYFGLKETSAVNSAILGNSDIIFTSILAMVVFREVIRGREILPYSLILIGSVFIPVGIDLAANDFKLSKLVYGDFLVMIAGLFYGIEMNIYRYVSARIDSKRILQIVSFVGGSGALLVALALNLPIDLRLQDMPVILISGIFGIGVAVLFIVMAIKYIGAVRTILVFSTTTIFGIIYSFFLLGEEIVLPHFVAFGIVFFGIYLLRNRMAEEP